MKLIVIFSCILTAVEMHVSTSTEILYVLPDNSTNSSCLTQPCATLSQYLLDNGTLSVVSNVEYHFLPGEHHVPANMTLQNLYNFSIIGNVSETSPPVVLVGCSQPYVIVITNSHFVNINNVMFKHHCDVLPVISTLLKITNLKVLCCFSCKIVNITLLQYGFTGVNLIGESYLYNIKIEIIRSSELLCCQVILLQYTVCTSLRDHYSNHTHNVTINQLIIHRQILNHNIGTDNPGLLIFTSFTKYNISVVLKNSFFYNMDRTALRIKSKCSPLNLIKRFLVANCTFQSLKTYFVIHVGVSPVNNDVSFLNCTFHNNLANGKVIEISIDRYTSELSNDNIRCYLTNNQMLGSSTTNISFVKCQFKNNSGEILMIENIRQALVEVNVFIESSNFSRNKGIRSGSAVMISFTKANIYIKGPIIFLNNGAKFTINPISKFSIINFHSCNISFIAAITFDDNKCQQVILLDTYIKVMEHAKIAFVNNVYSIEVIVVESAKEYNQPHPFCLFQYIAINNITKDLQTHYIISFSNNRPLRRDLNAQNIHCSRSLCHFISHCKWLPFTAFYGYSHEAINDKIFQNFSKNCDSYKQICYRSQGINCNCSVDVLGPVYPGQILQANLCNMCSNDDSAVLYAEVHNINLPNSSCKIAHQSQLINVIGNHSNAVNYTIVSSTPDNDRCELFLTATPFLNKIYNVYYVQLLDCPIGFTLQDGMCGCDPILPLAFDECYIDHSAIKRPANTWIMAQSQANDTKYSISDCLMDYCLPYSSSVNLLHPDEQCRFNRTGILCSQCQHYLSMVFASSRCMKCTNVHILITIIVIVAGIVLVVLLYVLNLTVTIGTINGIILYANIVSINDAVFLLNNNVFKPLKVLVSFANLDLGIETCFYNGMDSYTKMWLQLFFPFYLVIIAASIIIASHYSSKILRLTYTRSLPVLATLFLLSYTGVLRTVSTVLFSYSTITHLPGGHKQIVWSIDASVPLFGLKFTILFITYLVLFLLLIPFSITLLFTRYLLQFRIINRFKPLIDAFQGSYKDKYYYWMGVHIILRSIFFTLYGFQIKLRLIIGTMILVLFTGYHGYTHPYKNKLVDTQELLLLINLTMMYAVSYQNSESLFSVISNIMISLACVQFCIIVLYHFFTYTCHCDVVVMLQAIKRSTIKCLSKNTEQQNLSNIDLLNIPDCTYNYTEYQDGLISDDFN